MQGEGVEMGAYHYEQSYPKGAFTGRTPPTCSSPTGKEPQGTDFNCFKSSLLQCVSLAELNKKPEGKRFP